MPAPHTHLQIASDQFRRSPWTLGASDCKMSLTFLLLQAILDGGCSNESTK
jgi:hypothetical protein